MDEFAMGSSTSTPRTARRTTRGTWTGSPAARGRIGCRRRAFEAPLALGSDTGGSIRQPAHVTGTVGIKPTYGGVSRYGAIALASSLDQVGPVSRTVLDAALHDVIGGHDPHDATSLEQAWPSFAAAAREGATGRCSRACKSASSASCPTAASRPASRSPSGVAGAPGGAGRRDRRGQRPHFEYGVAAYYLILPAEASSNLAKFDSVRFGLRVDVPGGTVEDVMAARATASATR
jgi:aspartyl-tRNA(Asn)/glutamyl-tRNA(Gln) amidotransferase subunit A